MEYSASYKVSVFAGYWKYLTNRKVRITPFAKLCKSVSCKSRANNIIKYLQPLVAWFEALENENDFDSITNLFQPILHVTASVEVLAYYNTPSRLVVIMREISNTIIRQATSYLEGDALFDLIDAGDTSIVVKKLEATLSHRNIQICILWVQV